MTAAVWGTVDVQALQQRFKYIDVIIMVSKMLTVHGVDKVFTVRTVIVPGGVKGRTFSAIGTLRIPFSVSLSTTSQ